MAGGGLAIDQLLAIRAMRAGGASIQETAIALGITSHEVDLAGWRMLGVGEITAVADSAPRRPTGSLSGFLRQIFGRAP